MRVDSWPTLHIADHVGKRCQGQGHDGLEASQDKGCVR